VDETYLLETAQETRRWLEESVGIGPDDVILEIGCGIGRVGQALAPRCKEWIGCDVSPNMLAFAQQRLAGCDNVRFVELSGFDLRPIASRSVDMVYCTVVFMHLDEWDRYNYVREAYRVLRPGGRVFVDNFNLRSDEGWGVFEAQRRLAPRDRPAAISKSSTPQELESYLQRAGFQGIRLVEDKTWVRAFGVKPVDAVDEGHAEVGPAAADATAADAPEPALDPAPELGRRIEELEAIVRRKDEHILRLEKLIQRIEHGRVMRILNVLRRRGHE
jgi:ubiquinone/menaquinone biosynthesis C-methylase UbiE